MGNAVSAAGVDALPNAWVAALFAVDPVGLGGVVLRCAAGAAREHWLGELKQLLPPETPWRRIPVHVHADRLLGGLDLAATLRAGRPIAQQGLLAEADGGIVLLAMAERVAASTAAHLAAVLDHRELVAERHGVTLRRPSRLGLIALDEGIGDDEGVPPRLAERVAFHLALDTQESRATADAVEEAAAATFTRDEVAAARTRFTRVRIDDAIVEQLCAAALALGVASSRAHGFVCRAARAAAALAGHDDVDLEDAALAARLVLAPRATQVPVSAPTAESAVDDAQEAPNPPDETKAARHRNASPPSAEAPTEAPTDAPTDALTDAPTDVATGESTDAAADPPDTGQCTVDDIVLEAALAAIPPGLLATLALGPLRPARSPSAGRAGAAQFGSAHGRPGGVRRGEPRDGARLNLIDTLRAAAPWQGLRRREAAASGAPKPAPAATGLTARVAASVAATVDTTEATTEAPSATTPATTRILVRREDFHVSRFKQRSETTTLFVVDASGSAALHRLAEAKGAVELLLADCYVRRDSVAVIAFRGSGAELLLPPTRSLVRAKRSLAGLPGGGGTPLAAGIGAAHALADAVRRRGATPVIVLLTDGRANIARDGTAGRARANDDALAAARCLRADGFAALLLDTSPQPQEPARQLATEMGARYLPLPHAGASAMSQAVRASLS